MSLLAESGDVEGMSSMEEEEEEEEKEEQQMAIGGEKVDVAVSNHFGDVDDLEGEEEEEESGQPEAHAEDNDILNNSREDLQGLESKSPFSKCCFVSSRYHNNDVYLFGPWTLSGGDTAVNSSLSLPYVGLCTSVSVCVCLRVRLPPNRGRQQRRAAAEEHPGARVSQV